MGPLHLKGDAWVESQKSCGSPAWGHPCPNPPGLPGSGSPPCAPDTGTAREPETGTTPHPPPPPGLERQAACRRCCRQGQKPRPAKQARIGSLVGVHDARHAASRQGQQQPPGPEAAAETPPLPRSWRRAGCTCNLAPRLRLRGFLVGDRLPPHPAWTQGESAGGRRWGTSPALL